MKLKQSYYTIITDNLNSKGDKLLFCTRTGEILMIPNQYWETADSINIESIPEDLISQLIDVKALVDENEDELATIIQENKVEDISDMLYEVIQPTAMCQLGCDYCGQTHTKSYVSAKLQAAIIDRIRKKLTLNKYNRLHIGWFGAEPLMGLPQMRSLTIELKKLCEEFEIKYTSKVVTNGLSLKENIFVELVTEQNVRQIEVTLDGTSAFHDNRRHTKEGDKTFDIIFNNLLKIINREDFFDLNCKISIRCNVDERNQDSISDLIRLLVENNFHNRISHFYTIGVYSWGNDAHKKSLTKEEFAKKEIDWLIEMYQLGFKPHLIPGRVKQVCLATSKDSEMYDAFGNVFNCTEVSYVDTYKDSEYVLAKLNDDPLYINSERPFSTWYDDVYDNKYPCHTCKMLPVCGGGCPKSWKEDMRACPSNKFNIKEKLMLSYVIINSDIKQLLNQEHNC